MEGEMVFSHITMGDIFKKISLSMPCGLRKTFLETGVKLKDKSGTIISKIFCRELEKNRKQIQLKNADIQQFNDFITLLGRTDLDDQLKNISLARKSLEMSEKDAIEECTKYVKMSRTLGISLGVLLVILMI
jgi:stage III sporulation protein AB